MQSQHKTGNLVHISPEDFDPYPGEFLKPDLEEKIYRSSRMLSSQDLANSDPDAAMEAMRNIYIAKHNAPPAFDAFRAYLDTQTQWERLIRLIWQERYAVRAAGDRGSHAGQLPGRKLPFPQRVPPQRDGGGVHRTAVHLQRAIEGSARRAPRHRRQAAPVLPRQPVREDHALQRAAEGSGSVWP